MKTKLFTGKLKAPNVIANPIFASVRIKKDTNLIRDGRVYKSEEAMIRNSLTRPKNVTFIKINGRLAHGLLDVEIIGEKKNHAD